MDDYGRATECRDFDASCHQDNVVAENGHVFVCVSVTMSLNNIYINL